MNRLSNPIASFSLKAALLAASVFGMACGARADLAAEAAKVVSENAGLAAKGEDGWLFLTDELRHVAKGPLTTEMAKGPVEAIVRFHTALAAEGVELIVAPVPPKAEIYPEKLSAKSAGEAASSVAVVAGQLIAAGVNYVDLNAVFKKEKAANPGALLYCQRDSHWSPAGIAAAAQAIATAAKDKSWWRPAQEMGAPAALEIKGDLQTTPETLALGNEKLTFAKVAVDLPAAADAPVLLLGDSHTLVFSAGAESGFHCKGAGVLDLLQNSFGQALMLVANAGGGSDMARVQLARKCLPKPDFWKAKKLVVWCFSAREFTSKTWKDIPIKKQP